MILDVDLPNVVAAFYGRGLHMQFISGRNLQPPFKTGKIALIDGLAQRERSLNGGILFVQLGECSRNLVMEYLAELAEVRLCALVRVV